MTHIRLSILAFLAVASVHPCLAHPTSPETTPGDRAPRGATAGQVDPLILAKPLPRNCYSERTAGRAIDTIVMHFISAVNVDRTRPYDVELCWKILRDNRVSAHYLVARDGRVHRLVPEAKKAWHAGKSIMPPGDDRREVNTFSLGIELVGDKETPFTDAQYESLARLCRDILSRYTIPPANIVGHEAIAGERAVKMGLRRATEVKDDPGPFFDWKRFRASLGIDSLPGPPAPPVSPVPPALPASG